MNSCIGTAIFDFDSTLVSCESLQYILQNILFDDLKTEISSITQMGIDGEISFRESLIRRCAIGKLQIKDINDFADNVHKWFTSGIEHLVEKLLKKSVSVWIISGGMHEIVLSAAKILNIPNSNVRGVKLILSQKDGFLTIDPSDHFAISKCEGIKYMNPLWPLPSVAIGDSVADYDLYRNGYASHFIAFTQNIRRENLINKDVREAKSVEELELLLNEMFFNIA